MKLFHFLTHPKIKLARSPSPAHSSGFIGTFLQYLHPSNEITKGGLGVSYRDRVVHLRFLQKTLAWISFPLISRITELTSSRCLFPQLGLYSCRVVSADIYLTSGLH
jgi:hypothetical protein